MIPSRSDQSFVTYQHTVIKELKAEIAQLTEQLNGTQSKSSQSAIKPTKGTGKDIKCWSLPFVFEITASNENEIEADMPIYLYIRDDDNKGLRVPARSGYILNDGPGKISYRLNNGTSKGWSHPATLNVGQVDTFDYTDNIQIVVVEITADTDKTRFRTRFTPGFTGG